MGRLAWAVYLWPGLPHVWKRGSWSGLLVAIGFTLLLNLALVSSLVWTELELPGVASRSYLWTVVTVIWIGSAGFSLGRNRRQAAVDETSTDADPFGQVLDQYLQQNWYEAERSLNHLLRRHPRDLDARLMLASVLRRAGRLDEAAGQLDRMSRMEGSRKWEHEIVHERQRLAQAIREANEDQRASDNSPGSEKVAA